MPPPRPVVPTRGRPAARRAPAGSRPPLGGDARAPTATAARRAHREVVGVDFVESLEPHHGEARAGERESLGPRRHPDDQRDRVGAQPAGDERQHGARPVIQPLRVVRDREEPGIPRLFGQEVQCPEAYKEQVRGFRIRDAERGLERVALRIGQPIDSVEDRWRSWWRPANGRWLSDCTPVALRTSIPRSRVNRSASTRSDDFPMPGRTTHEQRTTGAEEVADRVDLTLPTHEGWGRTSFASSTPSTATSSSGSILKA